MALPLCAILSPSAIWDWDTHTHTRYHHNPLEVQKKGKTHERSRIATTAKNTAQQSIYMAHSAFMIISDYPLLPPHNILVIFLADHQETGSLSAANSRDRLTEITSWWQLIINKLIINKPFAMPKGWALLLEHESTPPVSHTSLGNEWPAGIWESQARTVSASCYHCPHLIHRG